MNYLFKYIIIKIIYFFYSCGGKAIIVYNFKGFISLSNKKANEILGYSPKELNCKSFLCIVPKHMIANKLTLYEKIIYEDIKEKNYTLRSRVKKDGSEIKVFNKMKSYKWLNIYISLLKIFK